MFSYSSSMTIYGGMPMCCPPPMPMQPMYYAPYTPYMGGCCHRPIFGCGMPIMNNSMAAGWCSGTIFGLWLGAVLNKK